MKQIRFDYWLFLSVLLLVGVGIAIIYSSSGYYAERNGFSSTYYGMRHLKMVVVGLVAMLVGFSIPPAFWKKTSRLLYAFALLLLVLVLVMGVGKFGATRWIRIAGINFQPSEFAKIATVMMVSYKLAQNKESLSNFKFGLVTPIAIASIVFILLLKQPNYSTASAILIVTLMLMFAAGTKIKHFAGFFAGALPLVGFLAVSSGYRRRRIMAFFDPSQNAGTAYQQEQSISSLGNGGFWGTGLGNGTQKLGYLPEPHTDTVFAMLGEELGFVGTSLVLSLFGLIAWRGVLVAKKQEDPFLSLVALGLILSLSVNVFIHIGVCVRLLPATGQTLPLISYGGTSLVMNLFAIGIVLAISNYKYPAKNHSWKAGAV